MLFRIRHITRFRDSQPVFMEPLEVHLRPRSDATQSLRSFDMLVTPEPDGRSESIDLESNASTWLVFNDTQDRLTIETVSEVETLRTNPFDFVLAPLTAAELPWPFPQKGPPSIEPFLTRDEVSPEVERLSSDLLERAGSRTLPFLSALTVWIHENHEKSLREEGEPLSPRETLEAKRGACRDLAVLFMACCRAVGIPARFVSG